LTCRSDGRILPDDRHFNLAAPFFGLIFIGFACGRIK